MKARIVSVHGPFQQHALVEMDAERALELVDQGEAEVLHAEMITAARRDVDAIRERDAALGDSALAATVVSMAYELANPYNSATSKAACVTSMLNALEQLRALVPPEVKKDGVDEVQQQRARRRRSIPEAVEGS